MLYWALVFLVVAIVAAALGFGGIAGASAGIAKILFFIFLAFFVISLIAACGLVGLASLACGHRRSTPVGDVHEGPCRVDADCGEAKQCGEIRSHLSNRRGEIVGDLVSHVCEPIEPAATP